MGDPVSHPAPIDFELRLAGTSSADSSREARKRIIALRQPRQQVLELRKLDLELSRRALCPLGKDVEDELRPIEDFEAGVLGDVAALRRGEIPVEDQQFDHQLHRAQVQLLELSTTDEVSRIGIPAGLKDAIEHLHASGAGELTQLSQGSLRAGAISVQRDA